MQNCIFRALFIGNIYGRVPGPSPKLGMIALTYHVSIIARSKLGQRNSRENSKTPFDRKAGTRGCHPHNVHGLLGQTEREAVPPLDDEVFPAFDHIEP